MDRNGYREQLGCGNCKHVFIYDDLENIVEHFCTLGADKRPWCGLSILGEDFFSSLGVDVHKKTDCEIMKIVYERRERWEIWRKANLVVPNGICDCHILNVENGNGE